MANPFEKRATEYLRDDEAFLSVVSPEPLSTFFSGPAREDRLLDRLVMVVGTPGSGKTTMARLFQYSTVTTLLRNESLDAYKALISSLDECRAISDGRPTLLGARLPLESEYREFWEFPYPDDLKLGLMTALIQSRAVLAWIQSVLATGVATEDIRVIPRENSAAALASIGGETTQDILRRAAEVELAVYRISAALVPPPSDAIPEAASTAYRPFDVIDEIEVAVGGETSRLRPLVILDDAHTLDPTQFDLLRRWLARRELKVSRWLITRLDALAPHQVLDAPGLSMEREITYIRMQGSSGRAAQRGAFRKLAKDMSSRYLRRMDMFNRRGLTELGSMLTTVPETLSPSRLQALARRVDSAQRRVGAAPGRREDLQAMVGAYLEQGGTDQPDLSLASLLILLERYHVRTRAASAQGALFEGLEADLEPSRPLSMGSGVLDGSAIHLLHSNDRPYYYGMDALCDAAWENAEQFLHLASVLVAQLETKLIRGKSATLTARDQNRLLRDQASELVRQWDFPFAQQVRQLTDGMAQQCLARSLEPNAPLEGGAGAFGIPQEDFEEIVRDHERLASILQYAVAYNAITIVPNYGTKKRRWCLLELSGVLRLKHGLTLSRGGFLERQVSDLEALVSTGADGA